MRKIFYISLLGLVLFELLNVYFIMPFPGSQAINSIDFAYFLYTNRWLFRLFFGLMISIGIPAIYKSKQKWIPVLILILSTASIYMLNFQMSADKMFKQPQQLTFKTQKENKINKDGLVIGVEINGDAKAYPIRFMSYHHQVQDSVGGKSIIVTYCNVCRSGRVFEPLVNGHSEKFRLVGMDHFNAMFEDETTKTWWRQATGEAIVGALKGKSLPEIESKQMTIRKWFELYPAGKVMQRDEASRTEYDSLAKFERGKSIGDLTRTNLLSWKNKSWVVGIKMGHSTKVYDWNVLKKKRIINDTIQQKPIVLALSVDGKSFVAFERPSSASFTISHDTLFSDGKSYDFLGRNLSTPTKRLAFVKAYQEFWHSWKTFDVGK